MRRDVPLMVESEVPLMAGGHRLRVDFMLKRADNGKRIAAIELDGAQHFTRIDFFHKRVEDFELQTRLDALKEKELTRQGIPTICLQQDHVMHDHGDWKTFIKNAIDQAEAGSDSVIIPDRKEYRQGTYWELNQHFHTRVNGTCRAIRREIVCLEALLSTLPDEFAEHYIGHDFNVRSCKLLRRPDMFFDVGRFGVHIEIDKHGHLTCTELSELEHLEVIRYWARDERGLDWLYVLRVQPDGRSPMFRKKHCPNADPIWEPTEHFERKFALIGARLVPWIRDRRAGTLPPRLENAQGGVLVERLFFEED